GRRHEGDGEEREQHREHADDVTPPRVLEARLARGGRLEDLRLGERAGCRLGGAHRMFSSAFERQNEMPEIVATIRKMKIATVLASPKFWPLPLAIASL